MIKSVEIIIIINFGISSHSFGGVKKENILSIMIAIGRCIAYTANERRWNGLSFTRSMKMSVTFHNENAASENITVCTK